MKPFVGSPAAAASPGGRLGWVPDLWDLVLPIVGTVVLAELLGLVETGPLVRSLLAGLAFGAVIGRSVVVWRERDGNALPPERVRQIESSWILLGALVSLLLHSFA